MLQPATAELFSIANDQDGSGDVKTQIAEETELKEQAKDISFNDNEIIEEVTNNNLKEKNTSADDKYVSHGAATQQDIESMSQGK